MPRVTRIAVNGLRVLDNVELTLAPLNVLIGENGSGKSSLVEACELLRQAAASPRFVDTLYRLHGGGGLFRRRPGELTAEVSIDDDGRTFDYSFTVEVDGGGSIRVVKEQLGVRARDHAPIIVIDRDRTGARYLDDDTGALTEQKIGVDKLVLSVSRGAETHSIDRMRELLSSILVYLPLDTAAGWSRKEGENARGPRSTVLIRPTDEIERGGENLPSAYHTLRNRGSETWTRVLELIRLGLGDDVDDVVFPTDPGGGQISLALHIRGVGEVSSRFLSDGQLAYLAFVAILHVHPRACPLVVFDEPDHHLHPDLVRRVAGILEALSEQRTVLVTTHSDRLIDLIEHPGESVVLLSAPQHRTLVQRPDPDALAAWLKDYRGIGELRADGVASMVFPPEH